MGKRHSRRRQRGTAYVLTLAVTSMLIVLGLTATQIARGELEQHALEENQVRGRLAALNTLDFIQKYHDGNTTWRATAANASWRLFLVDGDVGILYAYVDPIDADMANDTSHPFWLYSLAVVGDTRRAYRVQITSDADGNLTRDTSTLEQVPLEDF